MVLVTLLAKSLLLPLISSNTLFLFIGGFLIAAAVYMLVLLTTARPTLRNIREFIRPDGSSEKERRKKAASETNP